MCTTWSRATAAVALILASAPAAAAQTLEIGAQVRPRVEARTEQDAMLSLRTRLHVGFDPAGPVRLFGQVQDVRATSGPLHRFEELRVSDIEVHQLYLDLAEDGPLSVRAGRQEVAYGGERLVGALDWAQRSRTFDGVRVRGRVAALTADVFGLAEAYPGGGPSDRPRLFGSYMTIPLADTRTLEAFVLHDRTEAELRTRRFTTGLRAVGSFGRWVYRVEGAYQFGERGDDDVRAYLAAARLGASVLGGRGRVTLWYDRLSGDDDAQDGVDRTFETLFATNHKYYGFADLFTSMRPHTGGRGLEDLALKLELTMIPALRVTADVHRFRAAVAEGLDSRTFADEIDLTAQAVLLPGVSLLAGYSRVLAGRALAAIGRGDRDLDVAYLMVTTTGPLFVR